MELLLILILALIVFGPHRLPEMMGQLGKAFRDFQRTTSQLSDEFNRTLQAELAETKAVIEETKAVVKETKSVVTDAATGFKTAATTPAPQLTTPASQPASVDQEPANGRVEPAASDTSTGGWNWETPVPTPPAANAAEDAEAGHPGTDNEERQDKPSPQGQGPSGARPSPIRDDALLPPY